MFIWMRCKLATEIVWWDADVYHHDFRFFYICMCNGWGNVVTCWRLCATLAAVASGVSFCKECGAAHLVWVAPLSTITGDLMSFENFWARDRVISANDDQLQVFEILFICIFFNIKSSFWCQVHYNRPHSLVFYYGWVYEWQEEENRQRSI